MKEDYLIGAGTRAAKGGGFAPVLYITELSRFCGNVVSRRRYVAPVAFLHRRDAMLAAETYAKEARQTMTLPWGDDR